MERCTVPLRCCSCLFFRHNLLSTPHTSLDCPKNLHHLSPKSVTLKHLTCLGGGEGGEGAESGEQVTNTAMAISDVIFFLFDTEISAVTFT